VGVGTSGALAGRSSVKDAMSGEAQPESSINPMSKRNRPFRIMPPVYHNYIWGIKGKLVECFWSRGKAWNS
jgi:hypothetical protein